jgi:alanyl-tRNA synthetase
LPIIDGSVTATAIISKALGASAFKLYDTNGIPLEVTKNELFERRIKVGEDFESAFQKELDKQKNLSKTSSKMKGDVFDAKG